MHRLTLIGTGLLMALSLSTVPATAEIRIGVAGPLSGQYADLGRQIVRGAERAVADINATGGVNGEPLVLETADDACEPRKALEAANALIAKGVAFVDGHYCSFTSIPAAPVYAATGIVMISPSATNPKLTDEGGWNVLRLASRDDAQGAAAGEMIAARFPDAKIAILDDGSPFAQGVVNRLKETLTARARPAALSLSFRQGDKDFSALVSRLKLGAINLVYIAAYHPEAGPLVKEIGNQGMSVQIVGPDTLLTDEFWTLADGAAEGALVSFPPDPLKFQSAAPVIAAFRSADIAPDGYTLHSYAAVQSWVQAATATRSKDGRQIAQWLRAGNPVRTALGELRFDAKGDVNPVRFDWYRWNGGKYRIANEPGKTP
jgi:branched-chain amino acid transport system substrate-binding protein